MLAEYHLLDLHPVSNSNGTHGILVVCFDVMSLARLIHRVWWRHTPDLTVATDNPNIVGSVRFGLVQFGLVWSGSVTNCDCQITTVSKQLSHCHSTE
jgi:hypothetical protein